MEYGLVEVRFPPMPSGSYLAWASWWHRVDRHLADEIDAERTPDVEVRDRNTVWERFLDLVSREASLAMLRHEPTIEPTLRLPGHEAMEASRVARARLAWIRESDLGGSLRPDPNTVRLMQKLLSALDAATSARALR